MTDNLKRLEEMALVGCTDQEIAHYFRCTLTPALLDRVRVVRERGWGSIPRPTPEAAEKARRKAYYDFLVLRYMR